MKTNTFSGYETGSFFDEMFDRGDDWLIRPYYEKNLGKTYRIEPPRVMKKKDLRQ